MTTKLLIAAILISTMPTAVQAEGAAVGHQTSNWCIKFINGVPRYYPCKSGR